jgi:nitroreductase
MKPIENSRIETQLRWRYATKKFDPMRKIAAEDWNTLEQALHWSPSSYGMQPWQFIVVTDAAMRERLKAASFNQPQITDASHLVVLCARKNLDTAYVDDYLQRMAEVRGVSITDLAGLRQTLVAFVTRSGFDADAWASRQVYIALGMFLSSAAMLGIDACPMEGIEPAKYDQILGLDQVGFVAFCVATAGYRAADDKHAALAKARFKSEDVFRRI